MNTEYLKATTTTAATRNSEEKRDNKNSKSCNWNWINKFLIRIVHKTKDGDDNDDENAAVRRYERIERRIGDRASRLDSLWCCTRVADLASYVNCTCTHVTPRGENHLCNSHHQQQSNWLFLCKAREKSVNAINRTVRRLHGIDRTKKPSVKQKVNQFDAQFVAPQYGEAGIFFNEFHKRLGKQVERFSNAQLIRCTIIVGRALSRVNGYAPYEWPCWLLKTILLVCDCNLFHHTSIITSAIGRSSSTNCTTLTCFASCSCIGRKKIKSRYEHSAPVQWKWVVICECSIWFCSWPEENRIINDHILIIRCSHSEQFGITHCDRWTSENRRSNWFPLLIIHKSRQGKMGILKFW